MTVSMFSIKIQELLVDLNPVLAWDKLDHIPLISLYAADG